MPSAVANLTSQFVRYIARGWSPPPTTMAAAEDVHTALGAGSLLDAAQRHARLTALVNEKLDLNATSYRTILDTAASMSLYPNYHSKLRIKRWLNSSDRQAFYEWVRQQPIDADRLSQLEQAWAPISKSDTQKRLLETLDSDDRAEAILSALYSGFVFLAFDTAAIHSHFASTPLEAYQPDFYPFLRGRYPAGFDRRCSLVAIFENDLVDDGATSAERRARLFSQIVDAHERLDNHCVLAVHLDGGSMRWGDLWSLCGDVILFAEKRLERPIPTGYFRSDAIESETCAHVPGVAGVDPRFDLGNEGLYFKDCFVLGTPDEQPSLLLIFDKNERDETPIPCPACRSLQVRGNSYPILGVRSWECQNPICPERSKYDRGNRYSLASLIKQEAIEEDEAQIPLESLRAWKRDIVEPRPRDVILEMLVRHYTLARDVAQVSGATEGKELLGRRLERLAPCERPTAALTELAYFRRALGAGFRDSAPSPPVFFENETVRIINGDALDALRCLPDGSFDGAVTSPPYYNAREYSQWPNIYCYLHDMQAIATEVYRTLREGGVFLYNIFDYFDNERNIVFSLMGKKRMILGAYATHLFARIGFQLLGNVVWDKGEIEGKRNFNQGNVSPYYQAPLNCWEHVLVFGKGEPRVPIERLPYILQAKPVIKMVRGENTHGHTAPFPAEVPELLLDLLPPGAHVLDPFGGSMTTAIAAQSRGFRCTCVELSEEYCSLGVAKLKAAVPERTLWA